MIFTAIGSCFKIYDLQDLKNAIRDENEFLPDGLNVLCFVLDKYKVVVTTNTLCLSGEHESEDFPEPTFKERQFIEDVSFNHLQLVTFETDDEPFQ
jgi:hypothetical protein